MAINKLNPYVIFNGTADKAIQLYERVLGAKVEGLQRFGDVPDMKVGLVDKNRVIHAMLHIGDSVLMISDGRVGEKEPTDSNIHLTLDFDDVGDMTKKFEQLAQDGKVMMPIDDTFWGAKFGMLTDAFGVRWMFNCQVKK